jgi:hypothetical protein
MTDVSPRESRWIVWRFLIRRQRVALALSGVLVSGLVALVSQLKSVTGDALFDLALQGHVAVSPLERFLFGLLITAGICIGWPVARRISTLRMMAAVAVVGLIFATIHRRWDLEGRHQYHRDKAADALFGEINRVAELDGYRPTGTCLLMVDPNVESDLSVQRWHRLGAYHEALARKYEFATSSSWLPVSSDPPPPQ